METELLSIPQCAQRRGVTRAALYLAIERGDLRATRLSRNYVVTRADCDVYTPISRHESGKRGGATRWAGHEKAAPGPKQPIGRPRKKVIPTEGGTDDDE